MSSITIESPVNTKGFARACAVLRQSLEQGGVDPTQFIHDADDRQLIESVLAESYKHFGNGDNVQSQ